MQREMVYMGTLYSLRRPKTAPKSKVQQLKIYKSSCNSSGFQIVDGFKDYFIELF